MMKFKNRINQLLHGLAFSIVVQFGFFITFSINSVVYSQGISTIVYPLSTSCDKGWFGDQCQFQCHCLRSSVCTKEGYCETGCDRSWFGPACQYYSLSFKMDGISQQGQTWLSDKNDMTCNNQGTQSVSVALDSPYPLTWIRVVAQNAIQVDTLALGYRSAESTLPFTNCAHAKSAHVDDKTLDIYCPTPDPISHVTLSGAGVEKLCSLYISGGRSVALKQGTQYSSEYEKMTSLNAVDGKDDGDTVPEKTCFQTEPGTRNYNNGWWAVNFSKPVDVVSAVITNRNDTCCKGTPVVYRLWVYPRVAPNAPKPYMYSNQEPELTRVFTVVPSPRIPWQARRVMVQAVRQSISVSFTICEVAVFGETSCSPGQFGRQCERTCNCQDQETCFVSTGGCPSGCAPGYTGENCWKPCASGRFGSGCRETCSENCHLPYSCNNTDGACVGGCQPGYEQPQCKETCDVGTYGPDCSQRCIENCAAPDILSQVCKDGTYGHGCRATCSPFCGVGDKNCSAVDGTCLSGCLPGYHMPLCVSAATSSMGLQLWMIIVIVVFVIVAIVAVVAVVLWRRRRGRKSTFIDDSVTAGGPGNAQNMTTKTQHANRDFPTAMQVFSNYDVIPASDPEEDAVHIYATDFDPYDQIVEKINDNSCPEPATNVVASNQNKKGDIVEFDIDLGQYIQMTDVSSPNISPDAPYNNVNSHNTTQLRAGGGDYLTPIDDDPGSTTESRYVQV